LGPNGAGKTTLLNIIAGLADYEGSVLFDGVPVDGVSTNKRQVSYLFQNLALFPHLDVASNIGYGLKVKGRKKEEAAQKVDELLKLMKVEHLKRRYPKNLSGGERQRVALARALATSPKALLLDEPFNSLDVGMCRCLRREIHQVQRNMGITTIFVTHDLADAEEMGDRFVVLDNGKIQQVASREMFLYQSVREKDNNSSKFSDCFRCAIDCYCKEME
jgi:ABC-type sulfate/molybdate transport systems ATPase subunit